MTTIPPADAGLTHPETDASEIESDKGIMNREEMTMSSSQCGSVSPMNTPVSDRPAVINDFEAANPKDEIIAQKHSTQSDEKLQQSSTVLSMESNEIDITRDQNAASTCDTLSRVRQGLREGRFEIPPFKSHDYDDTTHPAGTCRFPSIPQQLYLSPLRRRFDLSHLLPDRSLPFNCQIMEHVKSWAELGTRIEDDARRKEVLDHVFDVLQKAWFEALRLGYDSGISAPDSGKRRQRPPMAPTSGKRQLNLGQLPPLARPRQRKVEPSKLPIFVSESYKNSQFWGVTAGELKQAGISENRVRKRAATDLSAGDELLQEVLDDLETEDISETDWRRTEEVTPLNPLGRDLLHYSLFEVQMSRRSLNNLEGLYVRFTTKQQKLNTQKRIDEETKRHNLFLALALEVNDRAETTSSMSPESVDQEGYNLGRQFPDTGKKNSAVGIPLIDFMEKVVAVTNIGELRRLASSGSFIVPEFVSDTDILFTDSQSDEEIARTALRDLLQDIHSINSLSTAAEQAAGDPERHLRLETETAQLEKRITEKRSLLADLFSSLKHQSLKTDNDNDASKDVEMGGFHDDAQVLILGECATTSENFSKDSHETKSSDSISTNTNDQEEVDADRVECPQTPLAKHDHDATMEPCPPCLPPAGSKDEDIHVASPSSSQGEQASETRNQFDGKQLNNIISKALEEQAGNQSLVVKLRYPKGFDPDKLTSEKVFNHKGFRYRYTRASSLAERREMDEYLGSYVRQTCECPVPNFRFGRYEALCHPADPSRKTIIHGIWDNSDGSKAEEAEWFYGGGADCQPPAVQHDHNLWMKTWRQSTTGEGEGESDAQAQQGPEPDQPQLVNKNLKNVLKIKIKTKPNANIGKRRKMRPGSQSRARPLPASPLSQSVTTSSTKARKRARSASAGRPRSKRHAGKQVKYTEVDGGVDDDDEFVPSD